MLAVTETTTMVEGIGDEVLYVFGFSLLFFLLALAWSSTSVTESGMIRAAVFVIERRRRSSHEHQPTDAAPNDSNANAATPLSQSTAGNDTDNTNADTGEASRVHEKKEEVVDIKPSVNDVTSAEEQQSTVENDSIPSENADSDDGIEGQIKVRLKFLNDTQKLVDARLADQLGHFKQRHFGEELENHKIVRLIFNGQLLQRDQETLLNYGLFDNCVVHCHISSGASPSPPPPASSSFSTPQVELDLSRLMLPLFGLVLGLVWCCRIQYRQYFNATSTFALLCITGLFVVSVVAICMPTRTARRH